ncbi:MAG: hypothetical protein WCJ64_17325 [Rhodospirillaceae bacterium]
MSTIAFDTHAFVKRLTATGMPEPQAEVLADEQAKLIENRLATKGDLEAMRKEIVSELKLWTAGLAGLLLAALSAIKFFGH